MGQRGFLSSMQKITPPNRWTRLYKTNTDMTTSLSNPFSQSRDTKPPPASQTPSPLPAAFPNIKKQKLECRRRDTIHNGMPTPLASSTLPSPIMFNGGGDTLLGSGSGAGNGHEGPPSRLFGRVVRADGSGEPTLRQTSMPTPIPDNNQSSRPFPASFETTGHTLTGRRSDRSTSNTGSAPSLRDSSQAGAGAEYCPPQLRLCFDFPYMDESITTTSTSDPTKTNLYHREERNMRDVPTDMDVDMVGNQSHLNMDFFGDADKRHSRRDFFG